MKAVSRQALLWASLTVLPSPAVVQAQWDCAVNNGMTTITGYGGSGGAVAIPSTFFGGTVTSIGSGAFSNCTGLTSITFPNGVTNIGDQAFIACTGLTGVTIPDSVTSLGVGASGLAPV